MKTWPQLTRSAARQDIELRHPTPDQADLLDVATLTPLVVIAVGGELAHGDRDRVLRAAVSGALAEIRRRGA